MKITGLETRPPSPTAEPVVPTASFADLIAAPLAEGDAAGRDRAAGFQALGVFGRYGAVTAPALPRSPPPPEPPAHTTPSGIAVASRSGTPTPVAGPNVLPATRHGPALTRPSSAAPARLFMSAWGNPPDSAPIQPGPAGDAEPQSPEAGICTDALAERRAHREPFRPGAQVRLAAGASVAAVGVVVTAGDLSGDDVEHFRTRVRALLREYGLALDGIALNGVDRTMIDPLRGGPEQWR